MKRKGIIISLIFAGVIALLLAFVYLQNKSFQQDICFSDDSIHEAYYPVNSGMVTVADGVRMLFDTASSVSTITEKDIERLRELGYNVEEKSTLYLGYDPNENLKFRTKRYRVSLPAYSIRLSDGNDFCSLFGPANTNGVFIENLDFILSDDGMSHMGIDIIEKFVVEYSWTTGMVVLRDNVPNHFRAFAEIKTSNTPLDILGAGSKRYINLIVDNRSNDFLLNTAVSRIKLNIPEDDGPKSRRSLRDPYLLNGKYVDAVREFDQLVKIGDRAKYQDIHRSGARDNSEAYFCNPLNMFVNDVVMDFPNNRFLISRGAKMVSHSPGFGLAAE